MHVPTDISLKEPVVFGGCFLIKPTRSDERMAGVFICCSEFRKTKAGKEYPVTYTPLQARKGIWPSFYKAVQ